MEACHQCGLDIASRLVFQDDNVQVQPILIVRSGKVSKEHREQFRQVAPIVIGLDRTLDRSWSEFSSKIHVIEQCAEKRLCQAYIGMVSHKMSLITIFGHKHEIKKFIKNFYIFL